MRNFEKNFKAIFIAVGCNYNMNIGRALNIIVFLRIENDEHCRNKAMPNICISAV